MTVRRNCLRHVFTLNTSTYNTALKECGSSTYTDNGHMCSTCVLRLLYRNESHRLQSKSITFMLAIYAMLPTRIKVCTFRYISYYVMSYYITLYYIILYKIYDILYNIILYHIISYKIHIILRHTISYYTTLYYILYNILYHCFI